MEDYITTMANQESIITTPLVNVPEKFTHESPAVIELFDMLMDENPELKKWVKKNKHYNRDYMRRYRAQKKK